MKRVLAIPFFGVMAVVLACSTLSYVESGAWPWLGPVAVCTGFFLCFGGELLLRSRGMSKSTHLLALSIASLLGGLGLAGYAAWDDLGAGPLWWAVAAAALQLGYVLANIPLRGRRVRAPSPRHVA